MWEADRAGRRALLAAGASLLVWTVSSLAAELAVDSYTSTSATIRFEVSGGKTARMPPDFTFALTQTPGARLTDARVEVPANRLGATVRALAKGWMGTDYAGWYLVTFQGQRPPTLAGAVEGRVVLTFDRPVFVGTGGRTAVPAPRNGILRLPVRTNLAKAPAVEKPEMPFSRGIRMEVSEDGVYRITGRQLRALGLPTGSAPVNSFRLYNRSREVPILVNAGSRRYLEDGDEILFYAEALRGTRTYYTDYATANVYWLTWGGRGGARVARVSGSRRTDDKAYVDPRSGNAGREPGEFADTLHIEEDTDIRWLAEVSRIEEIEDEPFDSMIVDNWYWGILGDDELQEITIDLPGPSGTAVQKARFRVAFTGLTSNDTVNPDHTVELYLNRERLPDTARWDGQRPYIFTTEVSLDSIVHGGNTLTFRIPRRGYWDRVALNWIEVAYVRDFRASGNRIMVRTNPRDVNAVYRFALDGFTTQDLELWDIGRHRVFTGFDLERKTVGDKRLYTLSFQDSLVSPTRYFAQAKAFRTAPENAALHTIDDDWEFSGGIDYLMITTADMAAALRPLAQAHERRGLKTAIVDIQDIYNRFSYGIRDPESIRTMLRYVFSRHPGSPPRYLLLAGDCTHDLYKKNEELTKIPTHLTRIPGWGLSSDDGYFGTVRGDDNFCDLMVGRFPARNGAEMTVLVNKTVGYLAGLERGYWKDNLLLCGGEDPEFTALNNEVMTDIVGSRMSISRIDGNPGSPYFHSGVTAPRRVADRINAGTLFINFTGHGGGAVWSDGPIFHYRDLSLLYNDQWASPGRLPIVFSFTCLTGFFESVFYTSLGEEFLRQGPAGAVAFYGGSGYSKKNSDIELSRTVLRNAMRGHCRTLGELLRVSETSLLVRFGSDAIPHVRQYNLLGDPALPWELTPDSLALSLDRRILQGADTLIVRGRTDPVLSGTAKLRVTAGGVEWADASVDVSQGMFEHRIALKPGATTAEGVVTAYAWNREHEVRGRTSFTKDTVVLHDVSVAPAEPAPGDSVIIRCRIVLRDTAAGTAVHCFYTLGDPNAPDPDWNLYPAGVRMVRDTVPEYWVSSRPVLLAEPESPIGPRAALLVKFRATRELAESRVFPFPIKGRPDLVFTDDTVRVFWERDSLRARVEVLNKGSAASPPYSVLLLFGDGPGADTVYRARSNDALAVGDIATFTIALPDTQGAVQLSAYVNTDGKVVESRSTNNGIQGSVRLAYADLRRPRDTLLSLGGGLAIWPHDTLPRRSRLFLFDQPIAEQAPLRTESAWIGLQGEGVRRFLVAARPRLRPADTLVWAFRADPAELSRLGLARSSGPQDGAVRVFRHDTVGGTWSSRGGRWHERRSECRFVTAERGPLALGSQIDTSGPVVQMFVAGREVLFLDYAARNRPFNIIIHDPSGVVPSSIELLLNGTPLPEDRRSSAAMADDPATVTVTAYPPPMRTVDSLVVRAHDYAGNSSETAFAYMPGEDLRIKFFSCHPNPFTARKTSGGTKLVRFAYLLTDIADDVILSIHSMSGKRVWTWKSGGDQIGYQEVAWNGITDTGYRTANGTYYAKLVASNDQKRVKKIIRIAKLEGY